MKKKLVLALVLVFAFSMALAACGGGGGGDEPAPAPEPAPAADSGGGDEPAPAADPGQTWQVDIAVTLGEPVSPNWARLFKELQDRSGGALVTENNIYWSGSLLPIPEIPKAMQAGGATFCNVPSPNYPDILPLNTRIVQLPFMGLKDPITSAEVYMQLVDEFPELKAEMADYNMLPIAATTLGVYGLHFADQNEVHLPGDLKGRTIVPYKTELNDMLAANSASGTYIPPHLIFDELQRGTVDGYVNNWAFAGWFGLTDVVTQHVDVGTDGMFHEFNILCVNLDFYNSLPADLQQLWIDLFRNEGGYAAMWDDTAGLVADQRAQAEAKGDIMYVMTPEEIAAWQDSVAGCHEKSLDEINAQRGDTVATDIYNRAVEIIKEKLG